MSKNKEKTKNNLSKIGFLSSVIIQMQRFMIMLDAARHARERKDLHVNVHVHFALQFIKHLFLINIYWTGYFK